MTDDRIEVDKMILEIAICPREGVWWTVFMKVVGQLRGRGVVGREVYVLV